MGEQLLVELIEGPRNLDQLWDRNWSSIVDHLIIVGVSRKQIPSFSCPVLDAAKLVQLAESLIAIAGIPDYTQTFIEPSIPLRLDVLLSQLLDQHPDFLHPLLRNWCEWFGLNPSCSLSDAWAAFNASKSNNLANPSPLLDKLIERQLVCIGSKYVYLPLPVILSLSSSTQLPSWEVMPTLLHQLRHSLLINESIGQSHQFYQEITSFLRTPHPSLKGHIHRTTRARGSLVDIACYDWSSRVSKPVIEAMMVALKALYESNANLYQAVFNRVQGPVWNAVGQAMGKLTEIESNIQERCITVDMTSYADSSRTVSRELKLIAEAYTILTELETTLGVDRYLSGQALTEDISLVHKKVRKIAQSVHQSLKTAHHVYLRQWNLSNIESVILRLLNLAGGSGLLKDYFPNNQRRVIFLLVDGLGYTQFQWFLNTVGHQSAAPLASNIFAWLHEQAAFSDHYLLASNLVSITGSCLPTIYTGALPSETGVIGSHMMMEGHRLNVLAGTDEHHKLSGSEVADVYRRNVNMKLLPFAELAHQSGVDVRIFHGGSMRFKPLADFTYGKLRREGRVIRVRKADRIFSEALPATLAWAEAPRQKHLALLYYPLIDHSGHGCGPYTQFQTAELKKLNFVFTHFLVDMVHQAEDIFDGHTSVVITADHGMFESATTAISHRTVRHALGGKATCRGISFIYDNRAMYIYGVDKSALEPMRRGLVEYFSANELPIGVATRRDPLVKSLLCDPNSPWAVNCPDIILQFYGPGVFYYNEDLPSHMFLYGAHGGVNIEETFVPMIHFTLTPDLAVGLKQFF